MNDLPEGQPIRFQRQGWALGLTGTIAYINERDAAGKAISYIVYCRLFRSPLTVAAADVLEVIE